MNETSDPFVTSEGFSDYDRGFTLGDWDTEEDSATALDTILSDIGLWQVFPEVWGTLVQPRPTQQNKRVRVDRVLIPKPSLLRQGWTYGAIGIEIKKSGVNIGRPLAQMIDYGRAIWDLPSAHPSCAETLSHRIWLDWILLWPAYRQSGPMESFMTQNHLGTANSRWHKLYLQSGSTNLFKISQNDAVRIGKKSPGNRVGSR